MHKRLGFFVYTVVILLFCVIATNAYHLQRPTWMIKKHVVITKKTKHFKNNLNAFNTPYQHAISLVQSSKNEVLAAWYAGSAEHKPDVVLMLARYNIKQHRWSNIHSILTTKTLIQQQQRYVHTLGNPILAKQNKTILLFFVSPFAGWSTSHIQLMSSNDNGRHWSVPKELKTSAFFNISTSIRGTPLHYNNGAIAVPTYTELFKPNASLLTINDKKNISNLVNVSWNQHSLQPSIVAFNKSDAVALLRHYGTGPKRVQASITHDAGLHWTFLGNTTLPNPDAGVSAIMLNNKILLAYNPSTENRETLALALGSKNLKQWKNIKILSSHTNAEFSYPYTIRLNNGDFMLGYTAPNMMKSIYFNKAWLQP